MTQQLKPFPLPETDSVGGVRRASMDAGERWWLSLG